ncbi:MBL fold metallo-hydrolase [Panacibacter ginsenosidivorans]|uniref:MBL fold metallo-hydrolase n=1 Tax=Panacibacter ginsenosidivorans TaxID=1813871 RepID=A0A5B8V7M8_9BACT|nr:MBL fold metallo-hydrolase [Panacibacter ginsenosidivorans]QEC66706.1 MBL fold metallo-hydrolase [Panacibacter ginsenosidivorans]
MVAALLIIAVLFIIVYAFMQQKIFGKEPDAKTITRLSNSSNYRNGVFQNLSPTEVTRKGASYSKMMIAFLNKPKDTKPQQLIPAVKTNLHSLSDDEPAIVWFGHSSYLIKYKGVNVLVDPVFSGHASPFSFSVKAFNGADIYKPEDMPFIDMLIITHDHFDHLDYKTVLALNPKVKHIYTSLGVAAHLKHWEIDENKITEFDWWDTKKVSDNILLTAAPSRHFSGRKFGRGKTLWSSFILELNSYRIYIGGDSGYDSHFKNIGEKYGPFDLAILECGQYGKDWPYIHMMPEEVAVAAKDLKAKLLLPVHWAKFSLSLHAWNEPIERVMKAAAENNQPVTTPMIGEPVVLNKSAPENKWWQGRV